MGRMTVFSLVLVLCFLDGHLFGSENYFFKFIRESTIGEITEKVEGDLFMKIADEDKDSRIYFHVRTPVDQILAYAGTEMTLYYPAEKKAFVFRGRDVAGNLVQIGTTEKMNAGDFGFILQKKENIGNQKKEVWINRENNSRLRDFVIRRNSDGAISKVECHDRKGNLAVRMAYGNFFQTNRRAIPLSMESYSAGENGSSSLEKMILEKPKKLDLLPSDLENFKLPEGVTKKTFETP